MCPSRSMRYFMTARIPATVVGGVFVISSRATSAAAPPPRVTRSAVEEEGWVIDKFALQRGAGWSHYELEAREDTTAQPED
jgi:hypothetical protein